MLGRVIEVEVAAMLSIPTTSAGIGAAGREAAAMIPIPETGAGIGTAGREGIVVDPLEGPLRGGSSRAATMPNGKDDETPELEGNPAGAPMSCTRGVSWEARTAMIPKGGGPSPENIRSLHHAFRGGQRDERMRGGRAGKKTTTRRCCERRGGEGAR